MPRNLETERRRVVDAVENYLAPMLADPLVVRKLTTGSAVARALGISRDTLRRHGMLLRLQEAETIVQAAIIEAGGSVKQSQKATIDRLKGELADSRRQYAGLFEKYTKIQRALSVRRDIDLNEILEEDMPKPDRSKPASNVRRYDKRK